MHTYNTNIPDIRMRKYGRNLEKMVMHITSLKEKKQRQDYAEGLISIMRTTCEQNDVNSGETGQLWADLMAISDDKLEIDTPYPIAKKVKLKPISRFVTKPRIKFQCCGKLVTQFIETTCQQLSKVEEPKSYLCCLVKIVQDTHKNRSIKSVLKHIEEVSGEDLPFPHEDIIKWIPGRPRSSGGNRFRRKRNS